MTWRLSLTFEIVSLGGSSCGVAAEERGQSRADQRVWSHLSIMAQKAIARRCEDGTLIARYEASEVLALSAPLKVMLTGILCAVSVAVGTAIPRCPPPAKTRACGTSAYGLTSVVPPCVGWRQNADREKHAPLFQDRRQLLPGGPPLAALFQRTVPVSGEPVSGSVSAPVYCREPHAIDRSL